MNAGEIDPQILPSNDIYGSWFLLIGVDKVEGDTAAENDCPSAVEFIFNFIKQCVHKHERSI